MPSSTVADSPTVRVPSSQVTVPPASLQLPWLGVAESKVAPAGRGSVIVTPGASKGPSLVTERV
ncbi:MAG: hypothetical protein MAG451_01631 [Anaerolineales bacterium]|nr:hypothetical protein [Anaerolineales bacterium]